MSTPPQPTSNPTSPSSAFANKPVTQSQLTQSIQQMIGGAMANPGGGSAAAFGRPADNSSIYMGMKTQQQIQRERYAAQHDPDMRNKLFEPDSRNSVTYAEARLAPLDWSQDQLAKFVNQGVMNKIPGFDVNMGMPEVLSAWDDLVKSSFAMNSKDPNNPKWTPFDVMNTYSNPKGKFGTVVKGDWEYDIATGEKVRYVGPLQKTTTATQVNELTRADALALAKQSMATMLGRMPSDGEVGMYLNILNGYEKANPQTTTTTTNINPETGEAESSNAVTTGGTSMAGKQALLEEQMKKSPEYGAFQAATTGMSWLAQAVNQGLY